MSRNYSQRPCGPNPSSSSISYPRIGPSPLAPTVPPHPPYIIHPVGYSTARHVSPMTAQMIAPNGIYNDDRENPNPLRLNQGVPYVQRGPGPSSSSSYHITGITPLSSTTHLHPAYPHRTIGHNSPHSTSPTTVRGRTSSKGDSNDSEGPNLKRLNQAVQCAESEWERRPKIEWDYQHIRDKDNIIYFRAKGAVDGEDCKWSEMIWRSKNAAKEAAAPYATQKVIQRYNIRPFPTSLNRP